MKVAREALFMAMERIARAVAGAALALAAAGFPGALAQESALPLAPRDALPSSRPASGIFSIKLTPQPQTGEESEADAAPIDIRPSDAALAASKPEPPRKLVKVPLPPIPVRPKEPDAAAQPAQQVAALEQPPAVQPQAPAASGGGFLSWLSSLNTEPPDLPADAPGKGSVRREATVDVTDPAHPKRMSPNDPLDDDLEDDEARKMVEKQVPEVEIACLKRPLINLIRQAGEHFNGTPVVTSGYRNRGRRGSYHRKCEAADFFIAGVSGRELTVYLRALPGAGGVGTYCHTKSVHIDTGEPRNWHQCGFRRSFALRTPKPAEIGSR